ERKRLREALFSKFPEEANAARNEAWLAELGSPEFPPERIDKRISEILDGENRWVLIGGPPCQAYSVAGRSRVGGIRQEDHRVYLYKEYLRIIAVHQPAVFVMENVKGLLSAKVDGEKVFDWILRDLKDPKSVFPEIECPRYRIYSLVNRKSQLDILDGLNETIDQDYLIEAEKYGIPQKRHRIILLGVREDFRTVPPVLKKKYPPLTLESVIGDLPGIRSGLNRSFVSSTMVGGKKKRIYQKEEDSNANWEIIINGFRQEIISWNGFARNYSDNRITTPSHGIGAEYIKCNTPSRENPLGKWYSDRKLGGVCNHISRAHLVEDLKRYMFSGMYAKTHKRFPLLSEFNKHGKELLPDHQSAQTGAFADRFRVQLPDQPATTVTSHISKDGHYFIHYDPDQCRTLTVREAARVQTFPDNYLFCGSRTAQYQQVGNAVPPYLSLQIAEVVFKLLKKEEEKKARQPRYDFQI
ncbi:MAG: DNA cytosine methyltransferase, partial [Calditrichaeota bacterium]|nr:DNA cytosine methyltransferase [Calditrichota bacterium]